MDDPPTQLDRRRCSGEETVAQPGAARQGTLERSSEAILARIHVLGK